MNLQIPTSKLHSSLALHPKYGEVLEIVVKLRMLSLAWVPGRVSPSGDRLFTELRINFGTADSPDRIVCLITRNEIDMLGCFVQVIAHR